MTILLPPPKTVYVKLILTEKLVSEPEKKGTIDKELWPYSQSFVRRPCRRRDEGGREGGPPTNSGSASSVSSARPPARARPCPSASAHCSPPPPPSKSKESALHVPDNLISHMEGERDQREGGGEMGERERERERDPSEKSLGNFHQN